MRGSTRCYGDVLIRRELQGVGDAVDSFNLNQTYFESRGLHVLGGVFNRLATDGYYSLEKCREAVTNYFSRFKPDKMPCVALVFVKSLERVCSHLCSVTGSFQNLNVWLELARPLPLLAVLFWPQRPLALAVPALSLQVELEKKVRSSASAR